jgi:uncharacterized protein (DUF433 family)
LSTVRAWALGQPGFRPVLDVADRRSRMLSFRNLVEMHVLAVLRREKRVSLGDVRKVITELRKDVDEPHPLLSKKLLADENRRVFVERVGRIINMSADGQVEMRAVVEQHLARIDRDDRGIPVRLFPFTTAKPDETARAVSIDPCVQFGQPCLAGTRIKTNILAERIKAGDTVVELAADYDRPQHEIEAALRYHIAA